MTSMGHPLFFRKYACANDDTTKTSHECLDQILRVHNDGGFEIDAINCDNGFRSMLEAVTDTMECRMN